MPDAPSDRRVAAAQDELRRLVAAHAAGDVDDERLAAERSRIERDIGRWLLETPDVSAPAPAARPSGGLTGVLAVAVLAIAGAGYAWKGSPALAGLGAAPSTPLAAAAPPEGAGSAATSEGLQQIAGMVDQLAARMKERPDDAEGWTMLGRAYTVLGRFAEALPAYRRALELQPAQAALLADYADALIAGNGGHATDEAGAVLTRALALDPRHPKTLALAGTVAYDQGDFSTAIGHWQRLADTLPPGGEMTRQVEASIAEARARAGTPGVASPAASGKPVSGTVVLAPELARLASPDDSVFIFARAATGSRMPLAVRRARVADLPLDFTLDDSMAMRPDMPLSGASQVIVGARVSKSGSATPQEGDLAGETAAVAPGARDLVVRIGSVVGGR